MKRYKQKRNEAVLGLVMFMGLVKFPSISAYWSKKNIYINDFCSKTMSRNRFHLLLRFVHFANNESLQDNEDPKLHKVKMLVQNVNSKTSNFFKILVKIS